MVIETTTPGRELQLCALVSKANGEEPIGSAVHFESALLIELALPWPKEAWQAPHLPPSLLDLFKRAEARGSKLRPQALIPNPEYSKPGYTRLIYYQRPADRFIHYQKQEYLVPDDLVTAMAEVLLERPSALSEFEPYRQATDHIREILVCTHGSRDTCCGSFGIPIYETLRRNYAAPESLRVWRTSHTGGHRFAPTLIDFPEGRYWGRVEPRILDGLVQRRGAVADLAEFYRGWSALTPLEQVAERDIWLREGWAWLDYRITSRIMAEDRAANRADIEIEFAAAAGGLAGLYQATVEQRGTVLTLPSSGDGPLRQEPLYRVSRLVKRS